MRLAALAPLLLLAAGPALAQDATMTEGNTLTAPPEAWLGDVPHLVLMGTIGGRPVDIQYLDLSAGAEGVETFAGKREYLPGDGALRYGDFEVALEAVIGGIEKSFEVEIENFDFHAHPLPATFTLAGENFPEGTFAYVEVSAEWEAEGVTVNDEIGGWTGSLTLVLDEGTANEDGTRGDGVIGGLLMASAGDDSFVMSFTVPVAEYEIDD